MTTPSTPAKEQLKTDLGQVKSDLGQVVQEARAAIAGATHDAMHKLGCTRDQLADRYHSIEHANYQYVVRHPGRSLAAAAVIGIAIGYLLGLRRGGGQD
ncbi:DUF883 family protein [Chitinimonas koreensis]|uniref:DUF883 family protein n=1 Tax=Chitinimonas koreensis TaxID=356302 RepID=UPI00041430E2|nr:DUF883 family protein [Chitinimonas koreensis]QNM95163.1 DUF883 family protein [Chitinimonas koreensis]